MTTRALMMVLFVLFVPLGLNNCSELRTIYGVVVDARVSPQAVYVAESVQVGLERTATNYLRLCHKNPSNAICSKTAEVEVVKAVRASREARKDLRVFMVSHPDGLGAQGLYDAFKASLATLQNILRTYGAIQ